MSHLRRLCWCHTSPSGVASKAHVVSDRYLGRSQSEKSLKIIKGSHAPPPALDRSKACMISVKSYLGKRPYITAIIASHDIWWFHEHDRLPITEEIKYQSSCQPRGGQHKTDTPSIPGSKRWLQEEVGSLPRCRCICDARMSSISKANRDLDGVLVSKEPEMLSSAWHLISYHW